MKDSTSQGSHKPWVDGSIPESPLAGLCSHCHLKDQSHESRSLMPEAFNALKTVTRRGKKFCHEIGQYDKSGFNNLI